MKRSFVIILCTLAFFACKKDHVEAVISNTIAAPSITMPEKAAIITVTPADTASKFFIKWNKADYGVNSVVNYVVEMDAAGKNFSTAINLGNSTEASLSLSVGSLNNKLLNTLNLPANSSSDIEFRITAALNGKEKVYSVPLKITVVTYKEIVPEKLYVPGAYQNWMPASAPIIRFTENLQYEGYVYMKTGGDFKFTTVPDLNHVNYGSGGPGKLNTGQDAKALTVNSPGYYRLNADLKNLSYAAVLVQSFGIVGSATAGSWDNSTPMTYDPNTGLWKVTASLVPGALKFRANNSWDINYGPADSNAFTGKLIQTDGAVTISQPGSYTVTIDMGQQNSGGYIYTVVKN